MTSEDEMAAGEVAAGDEVAAGGEAAAGEVAQDLPLREELRGVEPDRRPQLDVPVSLNVNENPYGPSPALVAEIGAAVVEAAAHQPLPGSRGVGPAVCVGCLPGSRAGTGSGLGGKRIQ